MDDIGKEDEFGVKDYRIELVLKLDYNFRLLFVVSLKNIFYVGIICKLC